MRISTITAFALATIAISHGARAENACMTATDLAFSPSITHAIPIIDTNHKGCVTGEQIVRYRAALKEARIEEKARIVTLMASR